MHSRHLLAAAAIVAFGTVFAASASGAANNVSLTIRHQIRGCHTWSLNGGPYRASQSITIEHGSVLTVTDNAMTHMGASTRVVFAVPGVYRFVTKAGEDYMAGIKTIGEDNVLRLQVKVT
jgi:hypothetical protein